MSSIQPSRLIHCFVLFLLLFSGKLTAQTEWRTWSTLIHQNGQTYAISFQLRPSEDPNQVRFNRFEIMLFDAQWKALEGVYESFVEQTVPGKGQARFTDQALPGDNPYKSFSLLLNLPPENEWLTGVLDIPELDVKEMSLRFSSVDIMDQLREYIANGAQEQPAQVEDRGNTFRLRDDFWQTDFIFFLVVAVFLLVIRFFHYRIFHDRQRMGLPISDDAKQQQFPYPIIRHVFIKGFKKKKRLLLLTPEGITLAAVPEDASLEKLYTIPWTDQWQQAGFLRKKKSIAYTDISSLSVSKNAIKQEVQYTLKSGNASTIFHLPELQSGLCQDALYTSLGNRYQTGIFREYSKEVAGFISLCLFAFLIAIVQGPPKPAEPYLFRIFTAVALLYHLGNNLFIFMRLRFYEQLMVKQIKLPSVDITRLKWLGIAGKILVSITVLLWLIGFLDEKMVFFGTDFFPVPAWLLVPYEKLNYKDGLITFAIAGNLACFAYFLLPPRLSSPKNTNVSVLYVPAASDYGAHSLNGKGGRWAKWMGIQNPFPSLQTKEPGSLAYLVALFSIRYFYHFHPMRIIRIILGRPQDTTYQQIRVYAASIGALDTPVTPKEYLFQSKSANDDVSWLTKLENGTYSHAILQPYYREKGYAPGFEAIIQQMPSSRILINLIHFQENPEAYELFRMQLMKWLPSCQVPQHLAMTSKVYFLSFDDQGHSRLFPVKQYKGLKSFFKNTSVDLGGTLQSFFQ